MNLGAQPTNTNISNGLIFDGEPFLAINPVNNQNIVVAWIGVKVLSGSFSNVIKTKASFDGGNTWSAEHYFPHFALGFGSADPTMAFDNSGQLFLAYIDYMQSPDQGGIFVSKSSNGGLAWSTPTMAFDMTDDPLKLPIDRPWLVVDNSTTASAGTLYITTKPPSWVAMPNRSYYKVSTDSGTTWSNIEFVDGGSFLIGGSISSPMATPAVTNDGKFLAIYPSYVASQNPLPAFYLAKSVDQGQTLTYSTVFSSLPSTSNANFKKGYLLLTDPSNAQKMVFLLPDALSGDADIEAIHSNDGGATWSSNVRVNDDSIGNGKAQDMVWGAYNETGKLVVTWRDRRNSTVNDFWNAGYDFYYATSSDNGQTFGTNQKLSNQFIAFDSLIAENGNDFMSCGYKGDTLYTVWGDTRNGKMNIYFAKTLVSTNSTIGTSVLTESEGHIEVFPNPILDILQIRSSNFSNSTNVTIYNTKGEIVTSQKMTSNSFNIECKNWQPGVYLVECDHQIYKVIKK